MKISVARLSGTPEAFHFRIDPDWWRERAPSRGGEEERLEAPIEFRVRAHTMGDDLFLDGEAEATFSCACSRCLARYRHALRESFRIVLEPASGGPPADPEAARTLDRDGICLGDDLDAGWYRGSEIDLSQLLSEVVTLALPVQPLCGDDCRGLCPRCGVDRNRETCGCEEERRSSPFAALRVLRGDSGDI